MNLTKLQDTSTRITVDTGDGAIEIWAYPYRVTDTFLEKHRMDNTTPIEKVLPHVVSDWNLEYDVVDTENSNMEESATTPPKMVTKKLPLEEKAIADNVPIWLQGLIWQAIVGYKVPNLMR